MKLTIFIFDILDLLDMTLNAHFYFNEITEPLQCCNELEITCNQETVYQRGIPTGHYTKQSFVSNERAVYYNSKGGYFLYSVGAEWVVSYC